MARMEEKKDSHGNNRGGPCWNCVARSPTTTLVTSVDGSNKVWMCPSCAEWYEAYKKERPSLQQQKNLKEMLQAQLDYEYYILDDRPSWEKEGLPHPLGLDRKKKRKRLL